MKLNNKKKGELLVETIVAMSVAALMTLAVFGVFKSFSSIGRRETEYIHFETVCLDVDKYYDSFGKDMWDEEYFNRDMFEVYVRDTDDLVYVEEYMENFEPIPTLLDSNDDVGYTYKLTYKYVGDDLVLDIKNVDTRRNIINDLNYGKSEATDIGEYYEQVQENNPLVYDIEQEDE